MISISKAAADRLFAGKLRKTSGMNIFKCIQCGTCSSACPLGDYMDMGPRKIIHMCQLRLKDRVVVSNTPWICATCSECLALCPNGVDIPKVMEAIRLFTQRRNINYIEPSQIPAEPLGELPTIALVAGFRKHTA